MIQYTIPLNNKGQAAINLKTRYPTSDSTGLTQMFELNASEPDTLRADLSSLTEWEYFQDYSGSSAPSSDGTNIHSGRYYHTYWTGKASTSNCQYNFQLYTTQDNRFQFGLYNKTNQYWPLSIAKDTGSLELNVMSSSTDDSTTYGTFTEPVTATNYSILIENGVPTVSDLSNNVSYTATETLEEGAYFIIRKWGSGEVILSSLTYTQY